MFTQKTFFLLAFLYSLANITTAQVITIGSTGDYATLSAAASAISAGDTVLLQAETFSNGSQFISDLIGTADAPIVILAETEHQSIFEGGTEGLHFISCEYIEINGLVFQQQTGNAMNIDDGGNYDIPTHHITIRNCIFRDMAASGNNDLLKLSGLDNFLVENCQFLNGGAGGSGIDMVGCHSGTIQDCLFDNAGVSGIQSKGGTQFIRIQRNTFKNISQRALNLGGSTSLQYFRPPLSDPIVNAFEAADLDVFSNVFIGCWSPIAYVGCVRVKVYNNTFYQPEHWVIRILQETTTTGFLTCADNEFRNNIIYLPNDLTEVNTGPNTAAETFLFSNNLWFNASSNSWSPNLPVTDVNQIITDPLFENAGAENFHIPANSPAVSTGIHLDTPETDFEQSFYYNPPSIGAFEGNDADVGPYTVEENKIWTIANTFFFDGITTTTAYRFSGDTIINNLQYKKWSSTQDSMLIDGWSDVNGTYLREDALHRIYIYKDGIERILYDFSLEIGDTFEAYFYDTPCELTVFSIDNITLNNGETRKRIGLRSVNEPTEDNYWVQGIGSLFSLTDYGGSCFTDFGLKLLCCSENGENLYHIPTLSSCFITITDVKNITENQLKLYPNPTDDIVTIETDFVVERIVLFDLSGRKVLSKTNSISLDLAGLGSGVYLMEVELKGGKMTQRLVIKK